AEDGIRDFHVTGVQTCALPIFQSWSYGAGAVAARSGDRGGQGVHRGGSPVGYRSAHVDDQRPGADAAAVGSGGARQRHRPSGSAAGGVERTPQLAVEVTAAPLPQRPGASLRSGGVVCSCRRGCRGRVRARERAWVVASLRSPSSKTQRSQEPFSARDLTENAKELRRGLS